MSSENSRAVGTRATPTEVRVDAHLAALPPTRCFATALEQSIAAHMTHAAGSMGDPLSESLCDQAAFALPPADAARVRDAFRSQPDRFSRPFRLVHGSAKPAAPVQTPAPQHPDARHQAALQREYRRGLQACGRSSFDRGYVRGIVDGCLGTLAGSLLAGAAFLAWLGGWRPW